MILVPPFYLVANGMRQTKLVTKASRVRVVVCRSMKSLTPIGLIRGYLLAGSGKLLPLNTQ
jgi:hypothetical protein